MYPILFQHGGVVIPSYFAIISLAFVLGQIWIFFRAVKHDFDAAIALDLALIIMLSGFVGGRLLHIIYEYPSYYLSRPQRVFEIWKGGFVFYGGAILAMLCTWLYARFQVLPWGLWADLFAPIIPFVYGLGRVASFLSGSCYGRPSSLPWAVVYPAGVEAPANIPLHPAALYESLWSLLCVGVLLVLESKRNRRKWLETEGSLFHIMLILHGVGRIGLEWFRGDYRGFLLFGQSISTWISLAVILIAFLDLRWRARVYRN